MTHNRGLADYPEVTKFFNRFEAKGMKPQKKGGKTLLPIPASLSVRGLYRIFLREKGFIEEGKNRAALKPIVGKEQSTEKIPSLKVFKYRFDEKFYHEEASSGYYHADSVFREWTELLGEFRKKGHVLTVDDVDDAFLGVLSSKFAAKNFGVKNIDKKGSVKYEATDTAIGVYYGIQSLLGLKHGEEEFKKKLSEFDQWIWKKLYDGHRLGKRIFSVDDEEERGTAKVTVMLSLPDNYIQGSHRDLKGTNGEIARVMSALIPLTPEGSYLQVWAEAGEGKVIYIPYGKMLIVPAKLVHGGGFFEKGSNGHLRLQILFFAGYTEEKVMPKVAETVNLSSETFQHNRHLSKTETWLGNRFDKKGVEWFEEE